MTRGLAVRLTPMILGCLLSTSTAYGDFVTGDVNTVGAVTVNSNGNISFLSTGGVANNFTVSIPITMTPTPPANSTGTITNLTTVAEPVGAAFNDPDWMVFNGAPISFTLQFINAGNGDFVAADCGSTVSGHACTVPGSSLNLLNEGPSGSTATAVGISFSVRGLAIDTNDGLTDNFTGSFSNAGPIVDLTTHASLTNVGSIITSLGAGDNLQASYSGSFSASEATSAVPEPLTVQLFLVGLVSLLGYCLRQKRKPKPAISA